MKQHEVIFFNTTVRQACVYLLQGKIALVVILFYNTLSAARKFLRRRVSIVEKVTSSDGIHR